METVDTQSNADALGRPGASRGKGAYPQLGLVSLVENGTQVLVGGRMADYHTGEITLAKQVLSGLKRGMLCLADRNFFGYRL